MFHKDEISATSAIDDDRPITIEANDKLGFGQISKQLADLVAENSTSDGLIVGIEGEWGSGKSSLVNLAIKNVEERKRSPLVIQFSPWLIGERNDLLRQLFEEFSSAASKLLPESKRRLTENLLRQYVSVAPSLAAIASLSEFGGLPYASKVKSFFRKPESLRQKIFLNHYRN